MPRRTRARRVYDLRGHGQGEDAHGRLGVLSHGLAMDPTTYATATGASASVAIIPPPGRTVRVTGIWAGYGATATGTVTVGGSNAGRSICRRLPLINPGPAPLLTGWDGQPGETVTVTLSSGGAGVVGHLNVDVEIV